MRGTSSLTRSLRKATVDSHRQFHARSQAGRYYELAEREQQFQHPISGTLGVLPVETTFKILFDVAFMWDAGTRRDSQLGEPVFRSGFTFTSAPKCTIPYARVTEWVQDDDLNYIGAMVTVGVHNPLVQQQQAQGFKYKGMLHCTFQGYGMPLDPEGSSDAGADPGSDSNSDSNAPSGTPTGSGTGASSGGPPAPLGGPTQPGNSSGPLPDYPAGPLGGSAWTTVHTWEPFGALSQWEVPAKEGALEIAGDDGRLTTADPHEVNFTPGIPPGYRGDKYAAIWKASGKIGGGYKLRAHLLLTPTPNDANAFPGIVVNMQDRQRGLGFWWSRDGIGWTTDLRLLGNVQFLGSAWFWNGPGPLPTSPGGQDDELLLRTNDADRGGLTPEGLNAYARWCASYVEHPEVWVEVWRKSQGGISAALYLADPATGAKPSYISELPVTPGDPHFGPRVPGYFGWTMSYMIPGPPWYRFYPKRGVLEMKLFKES